MNQTKTKALYFDRQTCIACAGCVGLCHTMALDMYGLELRINQPACDQCAVCVRFCPVGAISLEKNTI